MRDWIAGHRVVGWLLCAAVLLVPNAVLAQVQYRTLTLAESAYLYSGLAAQAVLRLSSSGSCRRSSWRRGWCGWSTSA